MQFFYYCSDFCTPKLKKTFLAVIVSAKSYKLLQPHLDMQSMLPLATPLLEEDFNLVLNLMEERRSRNLEGDAIAREHGSANGQARDHIGTTTNGAGRFPSTVPMPLPTQ